MLRRLTVANFKSFQELDVSLEPFNVLVGGNASGKSNFIQILAFLRDASLHGLDNAVSMQGGAEFVRNVVIGRREPLRMGFTAVPNERPALFPISRNRTYVPIEETYNFAIDFTQGGRPTVLADDYALRFSVTERMRATDPVTTIATGRMSASVKDRHLDYSVNLDPTDARIDVGRLPVSIPPWYEREKLPKDQLLFEGPIFRYFFGRLFYANDIGLFDFDPKLPKRAVAITGKADLEEDGSNLAIVIRNILRTRAGKRRLLALLRDILPFVADLGVERVADKTMLFKIKDRYLGATSMPSSLLSDGTVNIAALIVALFFVARQITVLEEPERNIHPHLMGRVVDLMRQATTQRQLLLTTHNGEVVRQAGLDALLLITRSEKGFSRVSRPRDSDEAKTFLREEIGLDELFVQNLLGHP
jgi:predicted ATPase